MSESTIMNVLDIPINEIAVSEQVRTIFDEDKLNELAASIKENGILEPLIVSPKRNGVYKLCAGERRIRAAKMIGLKTVPAYIRTDKAFSLRLIQLVENLQREDLNDMDLSDALRDILDTVDITVEDLAKSIGKSVKFIQQRLRLQRLSSEVQTQLREGMIEFSAARALLGVDKASQEKVIKTAAKQEDKRAKTEEKKKPSPLPPPLPLPPESLESTRPKPTSEVIPKVAVKPKPKISTKTIRNVINKNKQVESDKQTSIPVDPEFDSEHFARLCGEFIAEATNQKGYPPSVRRKTVKTDMVRFVAFLVKRKQIVVKGR